MSTCGLYFGIHSDEISARSGSTRQQPQQQQQQQQQQQ